MVTETPFGNVIAFLPMRDIILFPILDFQLPISILGLRSRFETPQRTLKANPENGIWQSAMLINLGQ
jgi:hypothetical protein